MELKRRTLQGRINYLVEACQKIEADLRRQEQSFARLGHWQCAAYLEALADGMRRTLVFFEQLVSEENKETEVADDTTPIRIKRTQKLCEMVITWYDGRHCHAKTLCFWADPWDYRNEALQRFVKAFDIDTEDVWIVTHQWMHGNGQIVVKGQLYEIEHLDEVAPVVICMDGSTIVAVTQTGEDIPYEIEQIR